MKKNLILVFLLAILIHNSASALWYNRLSDSTVRVIYNASYDTNTNWHVNIPNTVYMKFSTDNVYRNYKVISIADNAFKNCTNIVSVSIGDNVTSIGSCAFQGCTALDGKLIIPNGVTTIGQRAFYNCSGIDSLTIGANVSSIGDGAFYGCTNVKVMVYNARNCGSKSHYDNTYGQWWYDSHFCGHMDHLVIGDSVQIIHQNAFDGCSADTLTVGISVASFGTNSFRGWSNTRALYYNARNCTTSIGNSMSSSLEKLILGSSVESIPPNAFYGFSSLGGKMVVPSSVISIGNSAFQGCSNIDSIELGDNLLSIGNNAFDGCVHINGGLVIPNNVTTIGQYAFQNCSGIDSLVIGQSVTTIGDYAFHGCTGVQILYYKAKNCSTQLCYSSSSPFYGSVQNNLQKLVISDSVQTIPNYAFQGCAALEGKLTISNSVTTIGQSAFHNCSGIDSLEIGQNVTTIGSYAFQGCTTIGGKLTIPNNVTAIEPFTFNNCSEIDSLIIGESVSYIGNSAFKGCSDLKGILNIPNSVTSIESDAFCGCTTLNGTISIPNNVTVIGQRAFLSCSNIDTIIIGKRVTTIGHYAFSGCSQLSVVFWNAVNVSTYPPEYYNGTPSYSTLPFYNGCTSLKIIVFGDSVTSIPRYAFYNCYSIDSLLIGNEVTSIGDCAFQGCTGIRKLYYNARNCNTWFCYNSYSPFYGAIQNNIQKIVIGDSVQTIPSYAFQGCAAIDGNLTIPNNVATIGPYAFQNCSGIDTLVIGEGVTAIGNYAFHGCAGIRKLYYNAKNCTTQLCANNSSPFYGSIQNNLQTIVIGNGVVSIPSSAFRNCTGLVGHLTIPSGVKMIGSFAFYNCSGLNGELILPDSITTINAYVFCRCSGIDSLVLGKHIASIGQYSFYNCTNLTHIRFSSSLLSVGQHSFSNCTNLSHIQFSPTLQSLGTKAFYNCDNLLSVDLDSAEVTLGDSVFADCDRLVTVDLGANATSIGNGAFAGCFRLTTVNMGNTVTSIGNDAFRDCIRLVSPKLSNALLTIGSNAFKGCSLITGQLNFPENVASIGSGAYSGCSGVTSLLMKPQNPPTIYASTFDSININIPVYVPCGRVLNYYVTDYWENFPNILEMEPYQVTLSVNNDAMGAASVTSQPSCTNPQAIIAATSNEGFHFTHWSDGNTNNPRVLSLNQDTSLVANFTVNQAYITVHSNDSVKGHVSGSGLYIYNAPVVLMATANEGYHFIHWNDGNTQNPRYVTAIQDAEFTAIFVSNLSNINVLNNNPDMGTVSGSGVYYYQNYATLSASPNYGYHFTHWNDGNMDNPRMLFVDRDTTFIASFALNVYAISASSENTTMGSVSGGGNYTYNMQISLTANANFGYHFSQWSDGNTQNPRNVVVTKDSVFTAQFAANTYTLSVSSSDPDMGSAYGAGTFTYNSQTTISAAANYGYHFTQWSDGNTENPRIVTVNGNREYTAMFAINFYTITVNSSNPALGSASGGGTYNYNSNISISATPNYGYHFTQWGDGNTQNPRNITVMQNATYTAQFAVNSYAVTVNSNSDVMGTVLGSSSYIYNTPATISAIPNYGYHFVQWNDGNTDNPRTIIVIQNGVYTAQFDYNTYTLTALSNNYLAGTVAGGGTYNYSTVVSVNAIPNEHYHFVQWNDLVTENPRNIMMTKDTMLTAQFAIDQHNVVVQSENATMGNTTGGGNYTYGTAIHLTATPNYGYHFVQWNDGSTQNPRTVIVSGDATYTAVFSHNIYTAAVQSTDTSKGTVSGSGEYAYLSTVTIQAIPQTGFHFTQWSDGETSNPRMLTVTQDTLVIADFDINLYVLEIVINDSTMGSVTGAGTYPYETTVTISANASEHHHFVQWSDGNTSNPRQIVVTSDISLMVLFAEDDKFLIDAFCADTTMGHVLGGGEYYAGMQILLTAVPNDHYEFVHWTDGVTSAARSVTVLENATYVAVFSPMSYDILAYSANEMWGTVHGTGTYDYHTTVTLEAVANPGYHFVCWNDGDTNAVRTILVEGNAVYIASFAEGVGVEEHQLRRDISIYPNPTTDMLYVDANDVRTIEIFNIYGQLLAQFEGDNKVDMSGFDAGTYIVRITHLDGILEKKVIKI